MQSVVGSATLPGGHIEIYSQQPLATAETFEGGNLLATIAGEGNRLPGSNGKWTILFPNVTTASGYFTGLAYLNESGSAAFVSLTLFDQSGTVVLSKNDFLGPKVQKAASVADLAPGWSGTGYILLTSDSPLSGLQVVGTPQGRLFGWNGVRDFARELFVPHIAEIAPWASTLSLVNPSPSPIEVTLDAFDPSGQTIHTSQIQVGANAQSSIAVGSLNGLAGQSGGSLRLTAPVPIIAANAFRNDTGIASVVASPAADVESRLVAAAETASATISAATGGTLTVPSTSPNVTLGGLTLVIPPGALSDDTQVQVTYTLPTMIDPDRTSQLVQYPIRLLPEGLRLLKPAQLTIPVYSALLANSGSSINGVTVAHHDDLTGAWVGTTASSRDSTTSTVVAQIDVLGDYIATIPAGQSANPPQSADPTLKPATLFRPSDASSTLDVGCILLGQTGAINALQHSLSDGIDAFLGSVCASIKAATQFVNGDVTGGLYTLATKNFDVAASSTISALCAGFFHTPAVKGPCDFFAAESVSVATDVGDYLGNSYSNLISADRNIAAFDNQVQRYVGWLNAGIPPNAIPTCSGGFYPDPTLGIQLSPPNCQLPDNVTCNAFNLLLLTVTPSYPCNPGAQDDFYNKAAVARFATALFDEIPKLGQAANDLKDALVSLGQQLTPKLTASFTVTSGTQGTAPLQTSVDATASAPQEAITGYFWDFGDGASGTGARASHTYSTAGPYTITLRIIDNMGTISAATADILVLQHVQSNPPISQSTSPVLALQQNTVTAPGSVVMNGSGFLPRTPIVISAVGEPGPVYSSSPVSTDSSGSIVYTFNFDASAPPSQYDVFATEETSPPTYSNTSTLTLTSSNPPPAAFLLSPSTAAATASGQSGIVAFLISGSGFRAGAYVRITYASSGVYGGVSHAAGETAATTLPNQIAAGGSSLSFSASLYVGSYNVVAVNPDGRSTSPLGLTVTAGTSAPSISLGAGSLSFTGTAGASNPASQAVSISNSGSGTLTWTASVTSGATWLSVSPQSGTAPSTITVSVNSAGLSAGVYTGSIAIAATGATNTPQNIVVALTLSAPPGQPPTATTGTATSITATSATLNSTVTSNGSSTSEYYQYGTTTAYGSTSGTQNIGTAPSPVSFPFTIYNLTCNTVYHFRIVAQNSYGTSYGSDASFTTSACQATATISLSAGSLSFTGTAGASNPPSQAVSISNSGSGTLTWTATVASGNSWLSVAPQSGTAPSTITVSVNSAGLSAGMYTGSIAIAATGATNTPQNVIVALTLSAPSVPATPTGLSPGASSPPGTTVTTLTPALTWSPSTGATQYTAAVVNVSTRATVLQQTVSTTSLTTPTLQNGTTYIWNVMAGNSAGTSAPSAGVYFTVQVAPVISGLSPSSYPSNNTTQPMLINGANFENGVTLTFYDPQNNVYSGRATTFVSSSQLSATFNNASDPGTWTVFVTNPNGQTSNTLSFSVTASAPTISSLSPSSYPSNNTNQSMLINGANFQSGATLTFQDPQNNIYSGRATTFVSSSQLSATFNDGSDPGTWTVFVTNPNGQTSNLFTFSVQ